jgi:TolB-like protein
VGAPAPTGQIGRELGVSYLLKGSAQRAGEQVRIHVTLLDAAADHVLWES